MGIAIVVKRFLIPVIHGCGSDPCLNGGQCVEEPYGKGYSCKCRDPFSGKNCDKGNYKRFEKKVANTDDLKFLSCKQSITKSNLQASYILS